VPSPREGVDVYSRADYLLTPLAAGKPIAIYTMGWIPRGDWPRMRQAWRCNAAGALHVLGLQLG